MCINCFLERSDQVNINEFDTLPKSVKKTVRYIKQDSTLEQLMYIQKLLNQTIRARKEDLANDCRLNLKR
ncbi:hypothetical protein DEU44_0569 [Priestia megaterium]|nr:hypothetical protein DEU44_0569 [Priestia megaterium]